MRLLVTGGRTRYLGRHVVDAASDYDVVAVGSGDADLRDRAAVESLAPCRADGVLFDDERRCPAHVGDLAQALVELARSAFQGVLNVAGSDHMSRFELGRLIARRDGLDPSSLRSISRAAARVAGPVDVRLDSTRARRSPRAPHP